MKLPIPNSRRLYGVIDPYNVLGEGEVFVQVTNCHTQQLEVIQDDIIITKEPCFHRGDLRKLKTVTLEGKYAQLSHLRDVIVFPTRGAVPIPYTISGSDLDGDAFFVCWEKAFVSSVKEYAYGDFDGLKEEEQITAEKEFEPDVFKDWVGLRHAYADYFGREWTSETNWNSTMSKLSDILNKAIDAPKKGNTFLPTNEDIKLIKKFPGYPHYHPEKRGSATFKSTSVIGKMYDTMMENIQNKFNFSPNPAAIGEGYLTALDDREYIFVRALYTVYNAKVEKKNPTDEFTHYILTELENITMGSRTIQFTSEFLNIFWRIISMLKLLNEPAFIICVLSTAIETLSQKAQLELIRLLNGSTKVITLMGFNKEDISKWRGFYSERRVEEMVIYEMVQCASSKAMIFEMVIEASLRMQTELGCNLYEMQKEYLEGLSLLNTNTSINDPHVADMYGKLYDIHKLFEKSLRHR